ncbi:hypothetical protein ACVWWO_004057 [Bradyrhizobium sp. F1.13.1]
MSTLAVSQAGAGGMTKDERFVILASSLGTVFEWYDFYLYGSLASIIGAQFFSAYPPATRDIFALLAFAAGFLVRPFGAIVFGRVGDIVGRKYTFLVTILIMGLSTFIVGLLPNAATIGIAAPIILIALRLAQGLALGGEYGGAATYVAEHAPNGKRGYYTSFIQTTATLGLFLSLLVILFTRSALGEPDFAAWGWRIPFLVSVLLLGVSVWIRLRLNESPIFQKMKDEGKSSKAPADGSLRQLAERQARAAGAAWRRDGPGRGLVHRPVLRAVLPAIDPQGRRLHRQPADRLVAPARDRLLHRVRHALRQDRPQADHPRRLSDRGADLLPDLQDDHHQRQPGAGKGDRVGQGRRRGGSRRLRRPVQPGRHPRLHLALRHRACLPVAIVGQVLDHARCGRLRA